MNDHTTLEEAKQVCPTTTRRLVSEGALLLDVRERNEVASLAFDVPAIVNIPLFELEQRWSELPKDREIVLVCESGERSLKATYYLQFQGFTRVSNMEGGLLKWMLKGFPVIGKRHEAPAAAATSSCCGGPAPVASSTGCCTPSSTKE
ncbi:rhodanese-like domain-containing protein [Comamonas sp. C11]|uniref:rhodanese-like domain-containing protein n=1 Tax=Comamonas sp. C11 TaxID=2966554 RepID=UPI0021134A49|nr:rhodanese-like domain-containing protein [Comamonas sp. C11]UUC96652.1 rhodanese-like domain-containing protein [Comamonas sp. C11]